MSAEQWLPIRYRDFYDVPRMFVLAQSGQVYLFESPFEEQRDEYANDYTVYRLPVDAERWIDDLVDWSELGERGTRLGTVPVQQVEFDETNRKLVNSTVLKSFS